MLTIGPRTLSHIGLALRSVDDSLHEGQSGADVRVPGFLLLLYGFEAVPKFERGTHPHSLA
jgi:hypothetical protein